MTDYAKKSQIEKFTFFKKKPITVEENLDVLKYDTDRALHIWVLLYVWPFMALIVASIFGFTSINEVFEYTKNHSEFLIGLSIKAIACFSIIDVIFTIGKGLFFRDKSFLKIMHTCFSLVFTNAMSFLVIRLFWSVSLDLFKTF